MLHDRLLRYVVMVFLAGLPLLSACPGQTLNSDDAGAVDPMNKPPLPGLKALRVEPARAALSVDNLGAPKSQQYQAFGSFEDGSEREVSAEVNWRLDNTAIGSVNTGGLFTTSNQAGGTGLITVTSGSVMATATIEVTFTPIIKGMGAPANAETLLPASAAGTVSATNSPTVVYPSNQTLFAKNLYKVLFQWNQGTGNDLFRLEFKSQYLTMSVYTNQDRWEPTAAQWAYMANTNAGGKVTWTVYGVAQASPATVYRSSPIEIQFSKNTVEGAVYYWSTTVAGIRRATVSDAAPTDFLTPAVTGTCVACHTVSRNGLRVGADIGGSNLGVYNVKDLQPVISPSAKIQTSWTTFNPDTTKLVTADGGVLTLRDGQTGAAQGTVPVGMGKFGTQPDWSPDGTKLVFALSASNKDRGIAGSSIATIDYANGAWSGLKVLVQSTGGMDTNAYPMFSPDSRWIAYTKANGNSDKNAKTRLYIISSDGTKGPYELARGNTVVSNQTLSGTAADVYDNMPTWAPTKPGETMFVAFSSLRAYGKVYAFNKYNQLWVTAVDEKLLPGGDPSFPAFRLPFQDATENTHRPFWVEDAFKPPPPPTPDGGTGMCAPLNADCLNGQSCCSPNICYPVNGSSSMFTCQFIVG